MRGRWPTYLTWSLGVLGGTLAFFHRVVFTDLIFLSRDIQRVYYPVRAFWAEQVKQGQFPAWYPFDAMGQPFAGSTVTGVFHPSNLLYLVLELTRAVEVNTLLCFPLAFAGVYALLRQLGRGQSTSVVGALAYAFGGYLVSMTNNLLYLMAAATVPWVLLFGARLASTPSWRWAGAAGLTLATILLAGDPQSFVVTAGTLVLLAWALAGRPRMDGRGIAPPASAGLWARVASAPQRRVLALCGAALALAVAVSAVQLVCAVDVLSQAETGTRTLQVAQHWSLHPLRLLDVALGNVLNVPLPNLIYVSYELLSYGMFGFWAESLYVGVPLLVAAGFGLARWRSDRVLALAAALVVLLLLLSLGRHLPVYRWLFELVPPWRPFRYPEKLFPHLLLWLLVLATDALDRWVRQDAGTARRPLLVLGGLGTLCAALAAACAATPLVQWALRPLYAGPAERWSAVAPDLSARLLEGAAHTALCCAVVAFALWRMKHPTWRAAVVSAAIGLELVWVSSGAYQALDEEILTTKPGFIETIEEQEGAQPAFGLTRALSGLANFSAFGPSTLTSDQAYAISTANALFPLTPASWGLETTFGYLPGASRRVSTLLNDGKWLYPRWLGLANVGYVVADGKEFSKHGKMETVIAANDAFELLLLKNPTAVPRAHLAVPLCVDSAEAALELMRTKGFRPGEEAAVECAEPLPGPAEGAALGTAVVTRYSPSRVEVSADVKDHALLVLADAYYTGWSATVDGVPARILPANYAFRGLPLAPGAHHVVFEYRTPHLALASSASVMGVLLCLAPWLVPLARRRRQT